MKKKTRPQTIWVWGRVGCVLNFKKKEKKNPRPQTLRAWGRGYQKKRQKKKDTADVDYD